MYQIPIDVSNYQDTEYLKTLKLYKNAQDDRCILKYNRDDIREDEYDTLGKIRSIVISGGKLIGFSPPKSTHVSLEDVGTRVEEFIDGTMINLCYDHEWVISTKSVLGANTRFYQEGPSFYEMFKEALNESQLSLDQLDTKKSYSFVLQHPKNRIVTPINIPALYIVEVYKIDGNTINLVYDRDEFKDTRVRFPMKLSIKTREELKEDGETQTYSFKGYMLKNGINREKCMNPAYIKIEKLRGNHHHLTFSFLQHLKEGTLVEWLCYFPEYQEKCDVYQQRFNQYIDFLYRNYVDCFIHKKKLLRNYDNLYKYHMYTLQGIYLNQLRPKRMYKSNIREYLFSIGPEHLHSILHTTNVNLDVF